MSIDPTKTRRRIHLSQSVDGALRHWSKTDWRDNGADNNMSGDELRARFLTLKHQGVKLLPIGNDCEGFSYETGCPGHMEEP